MPYVLAGSVDEFNSFVLKERKHWSDNFIWLNSHEKLIGTINPQIIRVGEWWKLKDIEEIEAQIKFRRGWEAPHEGKEG